MPGLLILLALAAFGLLVLGAALVVHRATWPRRRTAAYAVARGMACDPGDAGLAFEAWSLDRPGGVRLPVWEIVAPDGRHDMTAVLLHGWGQSRIDVLARLAPWPALARRIVLVDLRGHGDATGGPSRLGWGEDEDVLALLAALPDGPVVLAGTSLGAVIAIRAAASSADAAGRVAGVVADGPFDDLHDALRRRLLASGCPRRPFSDLALAALRLRGLRFPRTADVAARVGCPLLVVRAAGDPFLSAHDARRIAEAAPRGALLELAGDAHADVRASDPERFDAAAGAFVAEARAAWMEAHGPATVR